MSSEIIIYIITFLSGGGLTYIIFPRQKPTKKVHLSSSDFSKLHSICKTFISTEKKYDHPSSIDNNEIVIGNTTYKKEIL